MKKSKTKKWFLIVVAIICVYFFIGLIYWGVRTHFISTSKSNAQVASEDANYIGLDNNFWDRFFEPIAGVAVSWNIATPNVETKWGVIRFLDNDLPDK